MMSDFGRTFQHFRRKVSLEKTRMKVLLRKYGYLGEMEFDFVNIYLGKNNICIQNYYFFRIFFYQFTNRIVNFYND